MSDVLGVVLADDEPLARARLGALLGECEQVQLLAAVADGEAALAACRQHQPQVLLADIEMPGLRGTDLAAELAGLIPAPQVIFCTAYDQHAARAFQLGAADYVMKPVRLERLRQALERARRLLAPVDEAPPALFAQQHGEARRIPIDEVHYLLAGDKYVTVHHEAGQALTEASLRQLEQAHAGQLLRVHRNCLVPVGRLRALATLDDARVVVRIDGSDFTPEVSRRNLAVVRRHLRG
ncbi:LytTR family DNA-binding domain-containing protein [Oleiagrimonas sp. C23AA]|uniref:LytR/AlgR family response regulator transcription factor n=1 Tax=Oleiagrimonas sp. C23AA TaxID=2719047 RepID=UPI0014241F37|nr:LytTR family DNA-binding domain-containing protein [Oleiagrimonas sp. C23AA]NII11329.1 response regulator transcription factor [Oleiagrimonas sp. C23AA]